MAAVRCPAVEELLMAAAVIWFKSKKSHGWRSQGAAGEYDEAANYYRALIKEAPNSPDANYNLARIYAEQENFENALYFYKRAVLLKPEYFPVNYNYGNILLKIGKNDLAAEQYKVLLEDSKILPDALNNFGLVQVESGNLQEAVRYFEMSSCLNPQHVTGKKNAELARQLLEEGKN